MIDPLDELLTLAKQRGLIVRMSRSSYGTTRFELASEPWRPALARAYSVQKLIDRGRRLPLAKEEL